MRRSRHAAALALLALLSAVLACEVNGPTFTPSPPQMTASALNGTYQMEATQTWNANATGSPSFEATTSAPMATSTPTPSPQPLPSATPSMTLTSSIVEATANLTPSGPVEIWTPIFPQYGIVERHNGWYVPDQDENLRVCPSKECDIVGTLIGGHSYPFQGWTHNSDGTSWLCEVVSEDRWGAQYCLYSMLLWDKVNGYYGSHRVTDPTAGPSPTATAQ